VTARAYCAGSYSPGGDDGGGAPADPNDELLLADGGTDLLLLADGGTDNLLLAD
jgi:hypothetical protein